MAMNIMQAFIISKKTGENPLSILKKANTKPSSAVSTIASGAKAGATAGTTTSGNTKSTGSSTSGNKSTSSGSGTTATPNPAMINILNKLNPNFRPYIPPPTATSTPLPSSTSTPPPVVNKGTTGNKSTSSGSGTTITTNPALINILNKLNPNFRPYIPPPTNQNINNAMGATGQGIKMPTYPTPTPPTQTEIESNLPSIVNKQITGSVGDQVLMTWENKEGKPLEVHVKLGDLNETQQKVIDEGGRITKIVGYDGSTSGTVYFSQPSTADYVASYNTEYNKYITNEVIPAYKQSGYILPEFKTNIESQIPSDIANVGLGAEYTKHSYEQYLGLATSEQFSAEVNKDLAHNYKYMHDVALYDMPGHGQLTFNQMKAIEPALYLKGDDTTGYAPQQDVKKWQAEQDSQHAWYDVPYQAGKIGSAIFSNTIPLIKQQFGMSLSKDEQIALYGEERYTTSWSKEGGTYLFGHYLFGGTQHINPVGGGIEISPNTPLPHDSRSFDERVMGNMREGVNQMNSSRDLVFAQSQYDYTKEWKEGDFGGGAIRVLSSPMGSSLVTAGIGTGIGAVSSTVGSALLTQSMVTGSRAMVAYQGVNLAVGAGALTYAGYDIYKTYQEKGSGEASTKVLLTGINFMTGYAGYQMGTQLGGKYKLSQRASDWALNRTYSKLARIASENPFGNNKILYDTESMYRGIFRGVDKGSGGIKQLNPEQAQNAIRLNTLKGNILKKYGNTNTFVQQAEDVYNLSDVIYNTEALQGGKKLTEYTDVLDIHTKSGGSQSWLGAPSKGTYQIGDLPYMKTVETFTRKADSSILLAHEGRAKDIMKSVELAWKLFKAGGSKAEDLQLFKDYEATAIKYSKNPIVMSPEMSAKFYNVPKLSEKFGEMENWFVKKFKISQETNYQEVNQTYLRGLIEPDKLFGNAGRNYRFGEFAFKLAKTNKATVYGSASQGGGHDIDLMVPWYNYGKTIRTAEYGFGKIMTSVPTVKGYNSFAWGFTAPPMSIGKADTEFGVPSMTLDNTSFVRLYLSSPAFTTKSSNWYPSKYSTLGGNIPSKNIKSSDIRLNVSPSVSSSFFSSSLLSPSGYKPSSYSPSSSKYSPSSYSPSSYSPSSYSPSSYSPPSPSPSKSSSSSSSSSSYSPPSPSPSFYPPFYFPSSKVYGAGGGGGDEWGWWGKKSRYRETMMGNPFAEFNVKPPKEPKMKIPDMGFAIPERIKGNKKMKGW